MQLSWLMLIVLSLLACGEKDLAVDKNSIEQSVQENLKVDRRNYVIKNVHVISMQQETLATNQDVYVAGGQIQSIVSTSTTQPGFEEIDGRNKYLIPGLSDMHVHFINDSANNVYNSFLFLAHGVTNIRIMWGFRSHIRFRNRIRSGEALGPDMFVASAGFNGNVPLWPGTILTPTDEDVRAYVKAYHDAGFEYIKVYANISRSQYDVLIAEAMKYNMKPVGHLPVGMNLNDAVNAGQYSIEHLEWFHNMPAGSAAFNTTASLAAAKGTWMCPTLTVLTRTASEVSIYKNDELYSCLSPAWRDWYDEPIAQPPSFVGGHQQRLSLLKGLHQHGVGIISGTDLGIRYILPGKSLHEELEYYVDAGLTPYEALVTSTTNVARYLGNVPVGTIETGKRADLVLLAGNPLENISNIRTIEGVMAQGTWLSKEKIDETKQLLKKLHQ